MNVLSFVRYLVDEGKRKVRTPRTSPPPPLFGLRKVIVTVCHVVCTLLQLCPVLRYASAIYYGIKSRHSDDRTSPDRHALYKKCREEEILSKKLRLFESALEAGPQLVLQIYILLVLTHTQRPKLKQLLLSVASITTSWVGISWAHVAYHRAATRHHDRHLSIPATIVYFLWRLTEIGPRVLSAYR